MPTELSHGLILSLVPLLACLPDQSSCANPSSSSSSTTSSSASSTSSSSSSSMSSSSSRYPPCTPGIEFFSSELGSCLTCTKCAPDFTLSPCAIHKDAICGPLSALELDWSFLSAKRKLEDEKKERGVEDETSKIFWRFTDVESRKGLRQRLSMKEDDSRDLRENDERETENESIRDVRQKRGRRRSRIGEDGIWWDWQTGVLILAVCACVIFFLVAGCSALVYARQWRRMKRNFQPAGLEEISARLNLMVKAELAELIAGAPMSPGDPETRCQYLEKLLDRKRETPTVAGWPEVGGNVYIEEGSEPRIDRSQIARIHQNIDDILGQKRSTTT